MADAMRRSAASLVDAGIRDRQDLKNALTYVNYALFGTPLEACPVNIWNGFVRSGGTGLRMLWDSQAVGNSKRLIRGLYF